MGVWGGGAFFVCVWAFVCVCVMAEGCRSLAGERQNVFW